MTPCLTSCLFILIFTMIFTYAFEYRTLSPIEKFYVGVSRIPNVWNPNLCLMNYQWVKCSSTSNYRVNSPLFGNLLSSVPQRRNNNFATFPTQSPVIYPFRDVSTTMSYPISQNRLGLLIPSAYAFKPRKVQNPGLFRNEDNSFHSIKDDLFQPHFTRNFNEIHLKPINNFPTATIHQATETKAPTNITSATNHSYVTPVYSKPITELLRRSSITIKPLENIHEPDQRNTETLFEKFMNALDRLERNFFMATFSKLSSICNEQQQENGISFVQSGLFLQVMLMAVSMEVDPDAKEEIEQTIGLHISNAEKEEIIKQVVSKLPTSNNDLKFRWTPRLVFENHWDISRELSSIAPAFNLQLNKFNGTETPEQFTTYLNHMVEIDSGGAMHSTFDEDEMSEGVRSVLLTTLYVRGRWRAAPTLLNGTRKFRDFDHSSQGSVRMLRINDIMRYADLSEWNAEAVEINYATSGLSLLLLVPRGTSLRELVTQLSKTSLTNVTNRMHSMRTAVILPLYTLRMTLLLPNKLQAMGITRLVNTNLTDSGSLVFSHAVQRLMFWAEAGRNAFKDDGIEWDEPPEYELVVDRPYVFFVRWRNITLMNGNFVL